MRPVILLASLVVGCAATATSAVDPAPKKATNQWYLAVGHGGHRMLSRDGLAWEKHASWGEPKHDQNDLNVAANFKGAFYAGGGYFSGRLTATRDGEKWSDGVLPASSPIFGLEVLDDVLYAIDLRGAVFKTVDGEKWELVARAEMPSKTHWIRATAQGNGVIVGSGDFGPVTVFEPKTGKITVTQMAGQVDKNAGLHRVAFGNGVFVVCGQAGLLAVSKDGKQWENNAVNADRGDIDCVEFTGKEFLATFAKGCLRSKDGLTWTKVEGMIPRQIRRVNGYLYGYGWPPSKFSRSQDGEKWEALPNEKGWQGKAYAFGELVGGDPPAVPQPPKK
ncbi:MAG: hypothetical protein K8U57_18095 [Planctomycetes bacterium]|nr:hypothetical protein [Planctomycetota bacterium]